MSGRVRAPCGSRPGTGTDKRDVPLDQAACCSLALLGSGVMCSLPTCAQGVTSFCYGVCGEWFILEFLCAPRLGTSLAGQPLHVPRAWATQVCLSQDTGHYLRSLLGAHSARLKFSQELWDTYDGVICHEWINGVYCCTLLHMPA